MATLSPVVFTNAKILILKLITTVLPKPLILTGCIYQCKDTNFKANHNKKKLLKPSELVVFTNAKILILKLITTLFRGTITATELYLPMQRY